MTKHWRKVLFLVLLNVVVTKAAVAAFDRERASAGITDAVCVYPRKLGPVDAGMGGQVAASSQPTAWTMVALGTVHPRDRDERAPTAVDLKEDLSGPDLVLWEAFHSVVTAKFKAKYKLP